MDVLIRTGPPPRSWSAARTQPGRLHSPSPRMDGRCIFRFARTVSNARWRDICATQRLKFSVTRSTNSAATGT